jgi:hypothetical protein
MEFAVVPARLRVEVDGFRRENDMLAPLPRLYRHLVVATMLIIGVASGVWITQATSVSAVASAGAGLGALAGILAAYALVHDFSHRPRPRPVRVTPHR